VTAIDVPGSLAFDYPSATIGQAQIVCADAFEWMARLPESCLHAIVTDPPYGVKEFAFDQLEKRSLGRGGIWRIPPSFDGHARSPLPRFSALSSRERASLRTYFEEWSRLASRALRPGGHVFIATNSFLAQLVFSALVAGGLENRGQIIRLVRTLRGGDRPKNAEREFSGVSSLPKGCHEPWGLFRRPIPSGMTLGDCLRAFETGGLRRGPDDKPLGDVIASERTPREERSIARHPSLKPQSFLRILVHAALPLGTGLIADPFMGSGSTLAAAEAMGLRSVGVERHLEYFSISRAAIPLLSWLPLKRIDGPGASIA
jgi:site-specific DNA-methyltransferase (adenine-specific)